MFFGISYNNIGGNRSAKLLILIIRCKWMSLKEQGLRMLQKQRSTFKMKYHCLCACKFPLIMTAEYFTILDAFSPLIILKQGIFPFHSCEIALWNRLRRSHTESADEVGIDLNLLSLVSYLLKQAFIS